MKTFRETHHGIQKPAALLLSAILAAQLMGCDGDQSTVLNPNPAELQPKGTIQGILRDTVTQEPIVGATVDIGVGSALTSPTGQFVISNVPATTDSLNGSVTGVYQATIDMRSVTRPAGAAKYPDFAFAAMTVNYTSLNDAGQAATGTDSVSLSASNHDTPVTGLVASAVLTIGKLSATVQGVAYDATTRQPVGAGYDVKLVSLGSNQGGSSGATENIVATTVTNGSGAFSFANIEALRQFRLDVFHPSRGELGSENVRAPADGEVKQLLIQNDDADTLNDDLQGVAVRSTDDVAPFITEITPENNTDLAAGTVNAVFRFSEPINQNPGTDTNPSNPNGIHYLVDVNFTGMKASNIPYSLAWNGTGTQLTVTLPNLPAGARYAINLANAAGRLRDASENALLVNANTSLAFSTRGAVMPAAPGAVLVTNAAQMNQTGAPTLDWLPVSGAKGYNVYRATTTGSAAGTQLLLTATPTANSHFTDSMLSFVSGQSAVSYTYLVKSVSLDNTESAGSSVSTADSVRPTAIVTDIGPTPGSAPKRDYRVCFSEVMDEGTVKGATNYLVGFQTGQSAPTLPTIDNYTYNPVTGCMVVTLATSLTPVAHALTVSGMSDVAGNLLVPSVFAP